MTQRATFPPSDMWAASGRSDSAGRTLEDLARWLGRSYKQWENVMAYDARGDGSRDDTSAFYYAAQAAGPGGTIFAPPGFTFLVGDFLPDHQIHIQGGGAPPPNLLTSGTVLKAKPGADWVVQMLAGTETLFNPSISDLMIHGNSTAGGVLMDPGTHGLQGPRFDNVEFFRAGTGVKLETGVVDQNDGAVFTGCRWDECIDENLWLKAHNSQEATLIGGKMSGGSIAVRMSGGTVTWIGGQTGTIDRGFVFDDPNCYMLTLIDYIDEGLDISIDGSDEWPAQGVHLIHALLAAATDLVIIGGSGSNILKADLCQWNNGRIRYAGSDSLIEANYCVEFPGWGGYVDDSAGTGNNRLRKTDLNGTHDYFNDFVTPVANRYITGQITGKGVGTYAKAGVPNDGDFTFPSSGMVAVDTTNSRVYVRVGTTWKFVGVSSTALATYAATNVTTDRTFDANATTTDELADVLGTLIADLRARGVVA